MIIVEGADNLGKTVACHRIVELARRIGIAEATYAHMGRPGPDFDFGWDYKPMIQPHRVQDRFHFGSIVWHEGVMTDAKMSVITGWIKSVGGIIVVFASSDDDWYGDRVRSSTKAEMFPPEVLVRANKDYRTLAPVFADYLVDIGPNGFVEDAFLEALVNNWKDRLEFAKGVGR